jgi:hypothetical protein
MKEAGILDLLIKKYKLSKEFEDIYFERHKHSILFIEEIILQKKNKTLHDGFFFSYLAMNEVYSAIRDEIRSIILFNNGSPLSRWAEERNNIGLPDKCTIEIFRKIETIFDTLFGNNILEPTSDEPDISGDHFSEIVASLIFKFKKVKTQDAILLTTAISIEAKYFVTFDGRLIDEVKNAISSEYGLILLKPSEGHNILLRKRKS